MTLSFTGPRSTCQWPSTLFVLAMFFVMGCSQEVQKTTEQDPPSSPDETVAPAAADSKEKPTNVQIEGLEKSCTQDADCVLAKQGCCGCNSGGQQEALNKAHLEKLKARRIKGCAHTACLAVVNDSPACRATQAQCIKGTCEVTLPMQEKIKTMPIK